MVDTSFFDETSEQSLVKSAIVSKYFWAWANVIMPSVKARNGRLAYIDLFAGPGRYKDGTKSTPILVLEQAAQHVDMRQMLVTIFNDANTDHSKSLETEINSVPGIDKLKHKPQIESEEIGEKIVKMFEEMKLVPTLFFVDPWGYKGLSLRLVNSVLKDWGSDCIFFFNYNRINMGLTNDLVEDHMNALFGKERADKLRGKLYTLRPVEREYAIVEEIAEALKEMGGKYVLPFCFKNDQGNRTSHHLIFVSKDFKGYEIMKEIMAKESTTSDQGVPSFVYNSADKKFPLLFELTRPLDQLAGMLQKEYSKKSFLMRDVYLQHSIGKPYIKKNYKEALKQLEQSGKIKAEPPADKRRKDTFGDEVKVSFL